MKINAILVDDLPDATEVLKELIKHYCPELNVAGTAENALSALKLIRKYNPDLVFLDINMPGGNGFDLLEMATEFDFEVVFTTADEKHALKALKTHPVDYLIKPIDPDELQMAVQAFKKKNETKQNKSSSRRLRISSLKEIRMVDTEDIYYIEAEGRYSRIFLKTGEFRLVTKNIGELESELREHSELFRVSRSYIVNSNYIDSIRREGGNYIKMCNGKTIEVARSRKERFFSGYLKV